MDPLLGTHILRSSAKWSLKPEKPLLMRIGMGFSIFIGAFSLFFSLLVLAGGPSPIFGVPSQHLAREYFGSLAILGIFWGGMLLAIAYGFWKEKSWSRHLVIGFWLTGYLSVVVRLWMFGDTLRPILMTEFVPHTIFLAIAVWYFYLKSNIVDYFLGLDWWNAIEVAEEPKADVVAEEQRIEEKVAEEPKADVVAEEQILEGDSVSLTVLADLSRGRGNIVEAERLYKRALAIDEEALEKDQLNIARNLNNLGELYQNQGEYAEAEALCKRALAMREKILGPAHPEVAQSLHNLAAAYRDQGKYGTAESFCKRALAIWEKALGPAHPEVATALNTLADLSRGKGEFAEAERLYKRALAIDEQAHGKDHLNVARDLNNLALLYDFRGNNAEAAPLYDRALSIAKKALGPAHPEVATLSANIEGFYEKVGGKAKAEKLEEQAQKEYQTILKRVGALLMVVGIMDAGYMSYSIYFGKSYLPLLSVIGVTAGASLWRGSLRAARIVATSAAFFAAGLFGVVIALPILLPADLILTYLKIAPLSDVRLAIPFLLTWGFSAWIYRNLTSPPVKAGMDEAGINCTSFWRNPALGLKIGTAFVAMLLAFLVFSLKGERGARAIEEARKKMGSRYKFQIISMGTSSSGEATTVQAGVIAYDTESIMYVDVAWKEQGAEQTKPEKKPSKKKDK